MTDERIVLIKPGDGEGKKRSNSHLYVKVLSFILLPFIAGLKRRLFLIEHTCVSSIAFWPFLRLFIHLQTTQHGPLQRSQFFKEFSGLACESAGNIFLDGDCDFLISVLSPLPLVTEDNGFPSETFFLKRFFRPNQATIALAKSLPLSLRVLSGFVGLPLLREDFL